jgi:hypothetical protein
MLLETLLGHQQRSIAGHGHAQEQQVLRVLAARFMVI